MVGTACHCIRKHLSLPFFLLAISAIGGGGSLFAQDVNVSLTDASSSVIMTYDLSPVADGNIVRIGTFTNGLGTNRTTLESSNDFATLDALFTPLAEGIAGAGTRLQNPSTPPINPSSALAINSADLSADPGSIFMTVNGYTNSYMAMGTQLYVWAFNTNDMGTMQAGEWGIYTSTDSAWLLPDDSPTSSTFLIGNTIDIFLRGGSALAGVTLAPEPASALYIVAAGALLGFRRRRGTRSIG